MTTPNNKKLAILRLCLVGATMLAGRFLLPVSQDPAQSALVALSYSCVALVALLIFRPPVRTGTIDLLLWCLVASVLYAAILIADPVTRPLMFVLPKILMTLLLLAATVAIATRRMPVPIVVTLVMLFTLVPLWAGPAVELAGNPGRLTNTVVAVSPLTVFAVALDLDYLRTSWFYANSALGSMRYAYPGWPLVCLLLSIVPVAGILVAVFRPLAITFNRKAKEAHQ